MLRRPDQFESPSCATVGGDYWFPELESGGITQAEAKIAKSICYSCPHKVECAEWGIYKERFGIWGGLTDMDRRHIRRSRGIRINEENQSA
jgi:WhiB family transcriptional regulator, redox-sensing transcriptional regulator